MRLSFGGIENKANTLSFEKHCICDSRDYTTFMICCDYCDVWYHGACVQVTRSMSDRIERYSCPFCVSADASHIIVYKNVIREKTPRKKPSSRKGTPGKNNHKSSSVRGRTTTPLRDSSNAASKFLELENVSVSSEDFVTQPINTATQESSSKLKDFTNIRRSSSFGASVSSTASLYPEALTASLGSVPVVMSSLIETAINSAARFSTSPLKGEDTLSTEGAAIINYIAQAHQKKSMRSLAYLNVQPVVNKVIEPSVEQNVISENLTSAENTFSHPNDTTDEKFLTSSNTSTASVSHLTNGLKEISCDENTTTLDVGIVSVGNLQRSNIVERELELCDQYNKFLNEVDDVSSPKSNQNRSMEGIISGERENFNDRVPSSSSINSTLEHYEVGSMTDDRKSFDVMENESDESKENIREISAEEWIQNEEGLLFRTPRCNKSDFARKPTGELCTLKICEKKSHCDVDDYLMNFREKNRCASKLMELLDCSRSSSDESEHSFENELAPVHIKLQKCQNGGNEISPSKRISGSMARRALINIPETPEEKLRQRHNTRGNGPTEDVDDMEVVPQTPIGKIRRESFYKKSKLDDLFKNEEDRISSSEGSTTGTHQVHMSGAPLTLNNSCDGSVSSVSRRSQQLLDMAEIEANALNSNAVGSRKRALPQRFSQRNTAKRTLFR